MKPQQLRTAWLTALRSGTYIKGNYWLRQVTNMGEYTYCPLGVLHDLMRPSTISDEAWWDQNTRFQVYNLPGMDLPRQASKDVYEMSDPQIGWYDKQGLSFTEMADWLERQLFVQYPVRTFWDKLLLRITYDELLRMSCHHGRRS